jgi:hypothetical protein
MNVENPTHIVYTPPPRYNEPYVPADQAFIISKFVNAITNYSV